MNLSDAIKQGNNKKTITGLTGGTSPTVSHDTLTEKANLKGYNYTSISQQASANEKKKAKASAKKAKEKAQMDADNVNLAKKYSVFLANWYGDNNSFISGEIRVLGNPDYRPGTVLMRQDVQRNIAYIYYIESVSHEFSYTGGFTTVLGVTRGLPAEVNRFAHWNSSDSPLTKDKPGNGDLQLFTGGLFGEMTIGKLADKGFKENGSDDSDDSNDSSDGGSVGKGDDYPAKWRDATPDHLGDDWGYLNRECTSFVAWRLSQAGRKNFSGLHNANQWYSGSGLELKKTPKVGDVAWYNSGVGGAGSMGHVAYVAGVHGDKVDLEEYNYAPKIHAYHTRTSPASQASGYLRFPKK